MFKWFAGPMLFLLLLSACSRKDPVSANEATWPGNAVLDVNNVSLHVRDGCYPAWSPSGADIVYCAWQGITGLDILLADAQGNFRRTISDEPGIQAAPFWSPDGSFIGYTSDNLPGQYYPIGIENVVYSYERYPAYRLYFSIFKTHISGTETERLSSDQFNTGYASWASTGARLIFGGHNEKTDEMQIHCAEPDGIIKWRQTVDFDSLGAFAYSPDAASIVFEAAETKGGMLNLYTMDGNGENLKQLTRHGGEAPAWSPDGRWIAFSRLNGPTFDLYMIDAAGQGEVMPLLESETTNIRNASWSPDGRKILYDTMMTSGGASTEDMGIYMMEVSFK